MGILLTYFPLFVRYNHGSSLLTAILKEAKVKADYCSCVELQSKMDGYDVIGFSFVTDEDYIAAKPYIKLVKDAGKKVIAGGGYARRGGRIEGVDEVCRGEAEDHIVDYLNGWGKLPTNGHVRSSIDRLPFLDLSHITGYEFDRGIPFLFNKKIIPYQSSRGCYYGKCSFCEMQFQEKGVRIKHTIEKDLKHLKELYNPDLIYLMDTLVPAHLEEWKEQWKNLYIPFQCYIRADIKPENLEFLIDHGLKATAFGVESGDEAYRNTELNKGLTDAQIFETVRILQKSNVNYTPFFMARTPHETPEIARKTKSMIYKVKGVHRVYQYENLSRNLICL